MNRQRQAEQVGATLTSAGLHPAVRAWLAKAKPRGPWAVALSGGADSVALLLAVWFAWPERRDRLVALHFNHRLRGPAADADERFCRELCRGLGVTFVAGRWRGARRGASEGAARTARHEFFARTLQRRRGRVLWLAHQQDDIAESILMRLARGSGTGGLAAPRPVQAMADGRVHLRPLLGLKKAHLVRALRAAGVKWREDASNQSDDHFRNRVRRSVLPAWCRASGRDAVAGAALARDLLDEDDQALEAWVDRAAVLERGVLDVAGCRDLPRAVVRRALRRWLLAVGPRTDLSRQGFALLLAAVERGTATRFSLGDGFAVLRQGRLRFRRR